MKRLAVLLSIVAAACTGEGVQSVAARADGKPGTEGTPQKMSSLRVSGDTARDAPAADSPSAGKRPSTSQSMNVTGGATGIQIQGAGSNSQSMNVQAGGGTVTQRQSGSGNSQSMNIGVTDDVPAGTGAVVRP